MPDDDQILSEPLFTAHQVAAVLPSSRGTGIHIQTLKRRVQRGQFPAPDFKYPDGTMVWRKSTLAAAGL